MPRKKVIQLSETTSLEMPFTPEEEQAASVSQSVRIKEETLRKLASANEIMARTMHQLILMLEDRYKLH